MFVSGFATGGVPRVMTTLAQAIAERGHAVDLLVARGDGPGRRAAAPGIRVIDLAAWRRLPVPRGSTRAVLSSVPALARYLRRERPRLVLAGGNYANFTALAARAWAGISIPVIVSHHSDFSRELGGKPFARWVARHGYPRADAIVAVSRGVAQELSAGASIPPDRITTIYNPVVTPEIAALAAQPLDHPWFADGAPPVVLGVGRLHRQKDFPTLIRAFAEIRKTRAARLIVLGVAKRSDRRTALIDLANRLGVGDDVDLPGYTHNPFAYMSRAAVFVLSSAWEGLPTALIEAMACGCPVVSTDCPSGPAEILQDGRYGPLVPVGDVAALARATIGVLGDPPDPPRLRARAAEFSVEVAAERYLELFARVAGFGPTSGASIAQQVTQQSDV